MAIRQPFGASWNESSLGFTTLTKVNATAVTVERNITTPFSFLRIATATKGKTIKFFADDTLPAGAQVTISAGSASSELLLSSGFTGRTFINALTAGKGTGEWTITVMYNGTAFFPVAKPGRVTGRKLV